MNRILPTLAMFALGLVSVLPAQTNQFEWRRALAAGKTIEIVGVNGSIEATGTSGREVEVRAFKSGRRSDPEEVRIEVVEHADGITICAVYPAPRRSPENDCRVGGKGHNNAQDNDVKVTWTIRVPSGVGLTGRTINGSVVAQGITAPVFGYSVNGDITLATTAWAQGSTVNGVISARMGTTDWVGDAEFETVNGRITLELPTNASMDVDATSVNGGMDSDFPLTVRGRWGPQRMRGVVGQGGRGLVLTSVNGSVTLRRTP